jgi:hypothetical protein
MKVDSERIRCLRNMQPTQCLTATVFAPVITVSSSVITAALYYSLLLPVITDFPLSAHTTFVITVCIIVAASDIGALIISAVSYSDIHPCSPIVLLFQAIISPAPSGLTGIIRAWAEDSSQTMQGTISLRQCCVSTFNALALCCTMSFG